MTNSIQTLASPRQVIVFGCGPMPCDDDLPVMAPGARTWQIALTVADALGQTVSEAHSGIPRPKVTILGLEAQTRPNGMRHLKYHGCDIDYHPLNFEELMTMQSAGNWGHLFQNPPDCVVGCASIQPCASAAAFAKQYKLPVWIDVFGDPIAEIQSKAEISADETESNENRYLHVWKLLLQCLLEGDRFSGLSERQSHALLGQLGCAGRLNRHNVGTDLSVSIPYGLLPEDFPVLPKRKDIPPTVMWCGSFNTWMDEKTFADGIIEAMKQEQTLHLLIVGGNIPAYNEISYEQSVRGLRNTIAEERIRQLDWQPLNKTRELYGECTVGLSIDRYSVEAELGSRTRIVNLMAAGVPVVSTVITELTETLNAEGLLFPFEVGNPKDMARALVQAARCEHIQDMGKRCRELVERIYGALVIGNPLSKWIINPQFAPDKQAYKTEEPNKLYQFWNNLPT